MATPFLLMPRIVLALLSHLCDLVNKTQELGFPAATIQTLAEFSQQSQGTGSVLQTVY